ncbi:MAG: DUF3524 domain-containing protein [Spirochaetales bacterium]|nr:DUF3524 domain-containing protein [Spirochaetales bacterium]
MRLLSVETFYAGSHRRFLDEWISHSRHEHETLTLPGRHWKWRQAGSALWLAEHIPLQAHEKFDALFVSGMVDLSHLKALRPDLPPILLYVHENQFDYPLSPGEHVDFRYGLVDLVNTMVADFTFFNSQYNRQSLFSHAQTLFKRLPDALPRQALDLAQSKSDVAHPGVRVQEIQAFVQNLRVELPSTTPLIIWNHRHEHDKNPKLACEALEALAAEGEDFQLALLGERYSQRPPEFERLHAVLGKRILVDAYPSRQEYWQWLARGHVVLSTACHENFGIAVVEAVSAGCIPLLPQALAYPEVMPPNKPECFWLQEQDVVPQLQHLLSLTSQEKTALGEELQQWMGRYDWSFATEILDDGVDALIPRGK